MACTQEQRLFGELGEQTENAVSPVKFVNIRETGGWSRDASRAMPKIAALLAAAMLSDVLDVTLFTQGPGNAGGAQARRYPVLGGRITGLTGWLGAFDLRWEVGAIDFGRAPQPQSETFDLVLDLRPARATPTFNQHALPQGYFRWDGRDLPMLLKLRELVGEFEKPKFYVYKPKLCAHGRNETLGCNACVDICSAEAIQSEKSRQRSLVNPHLCVGCGACPSVCPSGALSYA